MKNRLILLSGIFFIGVNLYGQTPSPTPSPTNTEGVSISNSLTPPDPSAMLDVQSTSKGILIPRMTLSEREGISSPANGLLVYVTEPSESIGYWYWDITSLPSGGWKRIGSSGSEFWKEDLVNSNAQISTKGKVGIGQDPFQGDIDASLVIKRSLDIEPSARISLLDATLYPSTAFISAAGHALRLASDENTAIFIDTDNNTEGSIFGVFCNDSYFASSNNPNFKTLFTVKDETGDTYVKGDLNCKGLQTENISSNGDIFTQGKFFSNGNEVYSDSTLKKDIIKLDNVLGKLANFNTYEYFYKKDTESNDKRIGVIAQELELSFPDLVENVVLNSTVYVDSPTEMDQSNKEKQIITQEFKTVDYSGLTAILLQAIKEQQALIDSLNQRLLLLEAQ